jgi:diaminopimelate decarboxylase
VMRDAFGNRTVMICFALKANANLAVVRTLARFGAGADVVSEGEIRKALAAGVPPQRIVFSGVGKTERELAFAVQAGIYQVNVESDGELQLLDRIARSVGRRQPIAIRVNPDVAAGGHAKIATGKAENKFGVGFDEAELLYGKAATMAGVEPLGLAVHIGSQIADLAPLEAAFRILRSLAERLRASGLRVERLDLGGGLGVPYAFREAEPPLPREYGTMVARVLGDLDVEIAIEPGRMIVANAGILVSRVLYTNRRPSRNFLVLDAAMNDLLRPALYDAHHEIWPVREPRTRETEVYDVVGPICETGDTFAMNRRLPSLAPGGLVAFMTAGAYGASMASTYNARLLVPEVLVRGSDWEVVRPRQTYEELIGLDRLPAWLGKA